MSSYRPDLGELPDNDEWVARAELSSGAGPVCPVCHHETTADDPQYSNEDGFEEECPKCKARYFVQPSISVTWRTIEIRSTTP